jgi:hypothetical protein
MTALVPIALFGWIPFSIILFFKFRPHQAVLFSVIGGCLFLPMAGFDVPGIPAYTKNVAIAVGLVLGGRLSGQRKAASVQWSIGDIPMLTWCLCPLATSLSNELGWYDGIASSLNQTLIWGVPYATGRIYFTDIEKLKDMCLGLVVGGLLYVPLCLYEVRMSPQLSNMIYGFFPHSFEQHMRYGGFRPIVFMQHGLMVALWMAVTSTVAFWMWRAKTVEKIRGFFFSMPVLVASLAITTVLCKSVNGLFALAVGCLSYFIFFRRAKSNFPFLVLLLTLPLYIGLRSTDTVPVDKITSIVANFVDEERVESLGIRLNQENLFGQKAWQRKILGWGGYGRGWPVDPATGEKMVRMIDSTWLIAFSTFGLVGLISFFCAMLLGPWHVFRLKKDKYPASILIFPVLLSLVVVLFMIDALFNGMVNPVYILVSGAVLSWHMHREVKSE